MKTMLASRRQMLTVAVALPMAALATRSEAQAGSDDEDRTRIVQLIRLYEAALTQADVSAVLHLYGEDPVFMPEFASTAVGRSNVRSAYEQVFATLALRGVFHIDEITIDGHLAWVRTHSTGDFTVLATGARGEVGNNEFFLLRRERGAWRIHRYMFTANKPLGG
jgi:uncharacterized protein (TIGR02246 family)